MRPSSVTRLLFVLYCIEVGVFLLMVPWSSLWDRAVVQLPWTGLRTLALEPLLRSATSGFGAVHLVWGAHDLDLWLIERRARSRAEGAGGESTDPAPTGTA